MIVMALFGWSLTMVGTPLNAAGPAVLPPVREVIAPARDLLTVTGDAQVDATPDTATVRLGVQADEPTAAAASTSEAKLMTAVVAAIRNSGVDPKNIRTTELNLQPVYDYSQQNQPKLKGFQATNIVAVTTHQMSQIGPILDAALGAGANRVEGIGFSVTDDQSYRLSALRKAAQQAAAKARALAGALAIQLGTVASITEGVKINPGPMMGGGMRAMAAADASTPVSAGQLQISATVTLEYHIK